MSVPSVLLPYQQRWVADESPVKLYEKSRRVGVSWATASEATLLAAARDGMDCWYVGYNKEMAEEFIRDAAFWARHFQLAAAEMQEEIFKDEDKDILTYVIRFSSGFRVTALSSRPSNLRGKQGYVVIDEAAFHEGLDELLKAALALLMWGGRVAIVSTHNGVDNPFNELVTDVRAGKRPFSLHRTTLDDALEEGLFKRICLTAKPPRKWTAVEQQRWRQELIDFYGAGADEELFCVPRNSGGAYLSRVTIESRMVTAPVLRLEVPDEFAQWDEASRTAHVDLWCARELAAPLADLRKDRLHSFGEDFGRNADLTVIAPFELEQSLDRKVPFLVELRNLPFEQQRQVLFYVVDRLPRLVGGAMDATGNGQYLAEVAAQRYGQVIAQVKLSDKWYAENLPPFKAAFEDGTLVLPRDADVLGDLRALQVIDGVPKLPKSREKGAGGKKRHGDAAIALALGYAASRMEMQEFAYYPVKTVLGKDDDRRERTVHATAGFRARHGAL